ncbi:hypothetical protein BC832DRAFT_67157 [Gaertneriomyces semiglobifer]|nr:hypothetical protein BC832DRAFT_67157 [Gaertneriomyces semiglobifer]
MASRHGCRLKCGRYAVVARLGTEGETKDDHDQDPGRDAEYDRDCDVTNGSGSNDVERGQDKEGPQKCLLRSSLSISDGYIQRSGQREDEVSASYAFRVCSSPVVRVLAIVVFCRCVDGCCRWVTELSVRRTATVGVCTGNGGGCPSDHPERKEGVGHDPDAFEAGVVLENPAKGKAFSDRV